MSFIQDSVYQIQLSSQSSQGPQGPQGAQGPQGEPGVGSASPSTPMYTYVAPNAGTIVLTTSDINKAIDIDTTSSVTTATLPALSTVSNGNWFQISKKCVASGSERVVSSNALTISAAGAERIYGAISSSSAPTPTTVSALAIQSNLADPSSAFIMCVGNAWRLNNLSYGWALPGGPPVVPSPTFTWRSVYLGYDNVQTIDNQILNAVSAGFNLIILAFYMKSIGGPDPYSGLDKWLNLAEGTKTSVLSTIHIAGAKLILSAGGAAEQGAFAYDPTVYATEVCNYAIARRLDGVDWDLEGLSVYFTWAGTNPKSSSQLLTWFQTLNTTSRTILGGSAIITHAPQSPYFGPVGTSNPAIWAGSTGGYTQVYLNNPDIDAFNIQYYNQSSQYSTYASIFTVGPTDFPQTAVQEVNAAGVPLSKILVGAFLQSPEDGNLLQNDPAVWHTWVTQANTNFGWNGGMMIWQYHPTGSPTAQTWVQTIFP